MARKASSDRKVALALMKTPVSAATIEVLQRDVDGVTVIDHGTYWHVKADDEIRVDMERVSEELGEPVSLTQWLVSMSSFVGRAAPGADYFSVTSQMVELIGRAGNLKGSQR